jgi:hypothetical protein
MNSSFEDGILLSVSKTLIDFPPKEAAILLLNTFTNNFPHLHCVSVVGEAIRNADDL